MAMVAHAQPRRAMPEVLDVNRPGVHRASGYSAIRQVPAVTISDLTELARWQASCA